MNIANNNSFALSLNDISTFSLEELYCLRDNIEQDYSFQRELEKLEEKETQKVKQ